MADYEYKYIPASRAAVPRGASAPKNQYVELMQATIKDQFYNSSDWWTIQEETSLGSQTYANIDARVESLINAETGLKLGDDWKTLLFKELNHEIELGKYYIFDNNTWLTINTELIKNLVGTCTIRRCNNTLRWIDEPTGAYYEEPCAIEYMVKEPRDYATAGSPFMTPGGFLKIYTQFNSRTNNINENQRFLFGNVGHWTCYKVVGTGINDYKNAETYDNTSANILSLDLVANFVNDDLDDIANGIADVNTNLYTLTLNRTSAEGVPTDTIQLLTEITYNRDTVTRPVTWATSNAAIATVSANGTVTFNAIGVCIITASITDNPASDTCSITVTNSPTVNTNIVIAPAVNYILEGMSRTYTVYLYEDDVPQADTFTITCNAHSVPSTSYSFSAGNNGFTITNNLRELVSYLSISCVSGTNTRIFDVYLRGAWQNDNAPYA
jgi:hypothetical protein